MPDDMAHNQCRETSVSADHMNSFPGPPGGQIRARAEALQALKVSPSRSAKSRDA